MEFTDFAQLPDWLSQAATWFCGLLIALLSGVSLLGCLVCLGGTIVQTLLDLRHQRSYRQLASSLGLHAAPEGTTQMASPPPRQSVSLRRERALLS